MANDCEVRLLLKLHKPKICPKPRGRQKCSCFIICDPVVDFSDPIRSMVIRFDGLRSRASGVEMILENLIFIISAEAFWNDVELSFKPFTTALSDPSLE